MAEQVLRPKRYRQRKRQALDAVIFAEDFDAWKHRFFERLGKIVRIAQRRPEPAGGARLPVSAKMLGVLNGLELPDGVLFLGLRQAEQDEVKGHIVGAVFEGLDDAV